MSMSPSAFWKAQFSIDLLQRYTCVEQPTFSVGSPECE